MTWNTIDIKRNTALPNDETYDIELREHGKERFTVLRRKKKPWVQALILENPNLKIKDEFSYLIANTFRWKSPVEGKRALVSYTRLEVERKLIKEGRL